MEFDCEGMQYRFSDRYDAVFFAFRYYGTMLFAFESETPADS
jgi:hypothetical protein